ncbi:MAG: hypothetical protein KQI81_09030 [Deltaproteobacteria bacterium]|nr:hypothetical protein [Deltaproteobacteria bacterium]
MEPCSQIGPIAKIDDKTDELLISQKAMQKDLEALKKLVENHEITLMGRNGDLGLVADVRTLQTSVDNLVKTATDLVVALHGEKGDAGLVGIITSLNKSVGDMSDSYKWVIRLIVAMVITAVLGLVLIK